MNKIALIIPYFGTFPNYFKFWLKSVEYNSFIDWILITDVNVKYDYPNNVIMKIFTIEELRTFIQSKFDFKISLESPYKLCDFRPAYGYIFNDWIKQYEFWGYCDMDMIYGNLSIYLTDELLCRYNKIFNNGHLTIVRNREDYNTLFKKEYADIANFQIVFSDPRSFFYDENGISVVFSSDSQIAKECADFYEKKGFTTMCRMYEPDKVYEQVHFEDLAFQYKYFKSINKLCGHNVIFQFNQGSLYRIYTHFFRQQIREIEYLHMQKRTFLIETNDTSKYTIIPNKFISFKNKYSLLYQLRFSKYWEYNNMFTKLCNKIRSLKNKS